VFATFIWLLQWLGVAELKIVQVKEGKKSKFGFYSIPKVNVIMLGLNRILQLLSKHRKNEISGLQLSVF
jgi:hypothetical protein